MTQISLTEAARFIRESNRIEGILRDPTPEEIAELRAFVSRDTLQVDDLCTLVEVFAPGHVLRDRPGLNVRVGDHIAPMGGPQIVYRLSEILDLAHKAADPWGVHCEYETLHPFTDGNGRSGRALWLWQMHRQSGGAPLGFLHHFYYQTLAHSEGRNDGR